MGVLRVKIAGNWVDISTSSPQGGGDTPVGSIISWAGTTLPYGWLACDGTAVNRNTYAELFNAIGITWGAGDGTTTFNLPDLMGRVPLGAGTGSGLTARTLAAKVGAETHTLLPAETALRSHAHLVNFPTGTGSSPYGGMDNNVRSFSATQASSNVSTAGIVESNGSPHNNMQPSTVVLFIIRAVSAARTEGEAIRIFPNTTAMNASTIATPGVKAIVGSITYRCIALGSWARETPLHGNQAGPAGTYSTQTDLITVAITADPGARKLSVSYHALMSGVTGGDVQLNIGGSYMQAWRLATGQTMVALNRHNYDIAANAAPSIVVRFGGGASISTFSDGAFHQLSWMISPA